jgi:hypothetical protein
MSNEPRAAEIVDTETETEILFQQVCASVRVGLRGLRQELTVKEASDAIAAMAVTGVLERMRVMSGRQLAVLLAREANRHAGYVIHEPPRYSADEIADVTG